MAESVPCWNCGHHAGSSHFCAECGSLQPPDPDYFAFFGFPRRLQMDAQELQRRFYALGRRLHPDLYFRRTAREQQLALEATAILNDAYRTLREPDSRAEYLLRGDGIAADSTGVPPELVEEIFEWNLALERADEKELAHLRTHFSGISEEAGRALEAAFAAWDEGRSREAQERVRTLLARRRYLTKLLGR